MSPNDWIAAAQCCEFATSHDAVHWLLSFGLTAGSLARHVNLPQLAHEAAMSLSPMEACKSSSSGLTSCRRQSCSDTQELQREGVLISPRMMADHMPDYLTAVLQRLAEKAGHAMSSGENPNGDYTIDVPPTSPDSPQRDHAQKRRNSMEGILRNSLVTGRAYPDADSEA